VVDYSNLINDINNNNNTTGEEKSNQRKTLNRELNHILLVIKFGYPRITQFDNIIYPAFIALLATNVPEPGLYSYNHVQDNLQDYFKLMFAMGRVIEQYNNNLAEGLKRIKINNIFPQKTTLIPSFYRWDTTLVNNVLTQSHSRGVWSLDISKFQDAIWGDSFKLNNKLFHCTDKHGACPTQFAYQILTDGVSARILQVYKDVHKPAKVLEMNRIAQDCYIDEISPQRLAALKLKKLCGMDPGNIIYFYLFYKYVNM